MHSTSASHPAYRAGETPSLSAPASHSAAGASGTHAKSNKEAHPAGQYIELYDTERQQLETEDQEIHEAMEATRQARLRYDDNRSASTRSVGVANMTSWFWLQRPLSRCRRASRCRGYAKRSVAGPSCPATNAADSRRAAGKGTAQPGLGRARTSAAAMAQQPFGAGGGADTSTDIQVWDYQPCSAPTYRPWLSSWVGGSNVHAGRWTTKHRTSNYIPTIQHNPTMRFCLVIWNAQRVFRTI
eukprot:SAG31_NODE_8576_length_1428_cov_0.994733_2_plen_241_part_01